jgi:hypothetical protein
VLAVNLDIGYVVLEDSGDIDLGRMLTPAAMMKEIKLRPLHAVHLFIISATNHPVSELGIRRHTDRTSGRLGRVGLGTGAEPRDRA